MKQEAKAASAKALGSGFFGRFEQLERGHRGCCRIREVELLGRDLVLQSFVGCGVIFGLHSQYTGLPLRVFMQEGDGI